MNLLSIEIEVGSNAPAFARDAVAAALGALVSGRALEDTMLLTSELVTNAVRHADMEATDRIGLEVDLSRERLRVEVSDGGVGFDAAALTEPTADQLAGWGLHVVERVADGWGVVLDHRHTVWFELSL